jgi:imidazolonepropionase-like amidohydrolase
MNAVTVVRAGRVVTAPGEPLLPARRIVARDGLIVEIAPDIGELSADVTVVDAAGATVVAGLWNAHVHLTPRSLARARTRRAADLQAAVADLLTSHGFTTVADLASDPRNTLPLRRRIESGEIAGPRIWTATNGLYPHRGIPFYVRETVPRYLWWAIPTPRTPRRAASVVRRQLRFGADLTKLFTGSYVTPQNVKPMRTDIARAAAKVSHEHGVLVFAHTSNREGLQVALDAGVDVVAHVPDETEGVAPLLRRAAESGVVLMPTFQMFARTVTDSPSYLDPIVEAARVFLDAGGRLMFGTDVGYMADPTIDDELGYLERCGLGGTDVLRMLTTTPADVFGVRSGRVEVGLPADLTVLDGDPTTDLTAYARVRTTIRAGRVIWNATPDEARLRAPSPSPGDRR